ncbi:MAG: helix-turn-helix transcriptional regulator [Eubacteriales bacterium]|nr:helix-turn-helix transcriptional regulator [Eubacteriales bacterium]
MDYSKLIKELRKTLIVSQAELAKMLGCSFASVNRWENGLHEPTYKMKRRIVELCKKIGIKVEE